jgi:hypothetical protein
MKQIVTAAVLASLPLVSQEMPLKRVVLSTSGRAQFTHAGEAVAGSVIELPVRIDQVDDVLKSLTIFDAAGSIGAVSLPGKMPLAELFRDLPFDQAALESQPALLNALVGADHGPRLPRGGGESAAPEQCWRNDAAQAHPRRDP